MAGRDEALARIVALAREHALSARDITAALNPGDESQGSVTGRILAWVGGVFILCGLGFFIESFWADMNAAARIILYLGSGLVMLVLALVFMENALYEKATLPLFLLAAVFQSGGILVAFDELGTGGDTQVAVLAMTLVMLAQTLLVFRVHRLEVHMFLAIVFAATSLVNLLELAGMELNLASALTGIAILAAGLRLGATGYQTQAPFWLFVGGVTSGIWLFDLVEDTSLHLLYVSYPAVLVWLSIRVRSRILLLVGSCTMIGYLSWFTGEYFADSIGWPLALIIIGALFIGLSVFAVKISRDYITGSP